MNLKLKTPVYYPANYSDLGKSEIGYSPEIYLKNHEVISMQITASNMMGYKSTKDIRQIYKYKILDKDHTLFNDSEKYIQLILEGFDNPLYNSTC